MLITARVAGFHVVFNNFPAVSGEDYTYLTHEIIFNENSEKYVYVYIPILNDECLEEDESFSVNITTSMDCVKLVGNTSVDVYILNDDGKSFLDTSHYPLYKCLLRPICTVVLYLIETI